MRAQGVDALYLDTSTNLRYFTGVALGLTERLHGAVIPAEGPIAYLSPAFEEPKTRTWFASVTISVAGRSTRTPPRW